MVQAATAASGTNRSRNHYGRSAPENSGTIVYGGCWDTPVGGQAAAGLKTLLAFAVEKVREVGLFEEPALLRPMGDTGVWVYCKQD
jgi:hypothetical protein